MTAVTLNINSPENSTPKTHDEFLRFPVASVDPIPQMSAETANLILNSVLSGSLNILVHNSRQMLVATSVWAGDGFMYN